MQQLRRVLDRHISLSKIHTAALSLGVFIVAVLGIVSYQYTSAQWQEPTLPPPGGQPGVGGGGTATFLSSLQNGSDASAYTADTKIGGNFYAANLCSGATCVSMADVVAGTVSGGTATALYQNRASSSSYDVTSSYATVTGASLTGTTQVNRAMLSFTGEVWVPSGCAAWLRFKADGAALGGWPYGIPGTQSVSVAYLTDILTAGSHTFTVEATQTGSCGGAQAVVNFNSSGSFQAFELPANASVGGGASGGTVNANTLTILNDGSVGGNLTVSGTISGNGAGITNINGNNIQGGSIPRTALQSCPEGQFLKIVGGSWTCVAAPAGGSGSSVMHLRHWWPGSPPGCPGGWSDAGTQGEYVGGQWDRSNAVRTCYTTNACRVMYLRHWWPGSPPGCPGGWSDAGTQGEYVGGGTSDRSNAVRTCYICS